jgi:hypothetical protein
MRMSSGTLAPMAGLPPCIGRTGRLDPSSPSLVHSFAPHSMQTPLIFLACKKRLSSSSVMIEDGTGTGNMGGRCGIIQSRLFYRAGAFLPLWDRRSCSPVFLWVGLWSGLSLWGRSPDLRRTFSPLLSGQSYSTGRWISTEPAKLEGGGISIPSSCMPSI